MTNAEAEVLFDISMIAGFMEARGCIEIEDSRELLGQALIWAKEFESIFDAEHDDYFETVDEFAFRKLIEYGRKEG